MIFYESSHEPLALFTKHIRREKFSWTCVKKFLNNRHIHSLWLQSPLIIMMETQATTHCCLAPFQWESLWRWDLGHNLLLSQAFRWESLWRWDFRPHLVVVSGLLMGIPLIVGFRLSRCLWLSRSLFHKLCLFSQWISGYQEAFHMNFFLFQWNLGYHEALFTDSSFTIESWLSRNLSHELFFFMMEFWLSRSLSHEFFFFTMEFWLSRSLSHDLFLFHNGILATTKPLSWIFLFDDGILAIKEPFTRTFSFSWWNSGYQGAFHSNFFFFTMEFTKCTIWGKTFFIYTSQRVFT
jgi:hypothetical protein